MKNFERIETYVINFEAKFNEVVAKNNKAKKERYEYI